MKLKSQMVTGRIKNSGNREITPCILWNIHDPLGPGCELSVLGVLSVAKGGQLHKLHRTAGKDVDSLRPRHTGVHRQ